MKGDATERARITRAFYEPLFRSPCAARRVGWESPVAQELRLRAVIEALEPLSDIRALLDVGCGEGALLAHLKQAHFEGTYRGEDILPEMIEQARTAHPDGHFLVQDSLLLDEQADAVVCCGTLNTSAGAPDGHAQGLSQLWERTRTVLVVVVAVSDRHRQGSMLTPAHIGDLWTAARRLSTSCLIREDLNPGEAMLILRRDRSRTLDRLLPGEERALERAQILAAAGQHHGVMRELGHLKTSTPAAALCWALSAAGAGRVRDAESVLRGLVTDVQVGAEARVGLGSILLNTGRADEGVRLLHTESQSSSPARDDALMMLVRHSLNISQPQAARASADQIEDPWIRREAEALLDGA